MQTRALTPADLPALTALYAADDRHWFGAVEHDADEVAEEFGRIPDPATQSLALWRDDDLVGAAWWWGVETTVLALAGPDRPAALVVLLDFLRDAGAGRTTVLATDTALLDEVARRGWEHRHSAFDLVRPVTPDWELAEPAWPIGIEVSPATAEELPSLHRLVYDDAGWAEIPGHVCREPDEWRSLFVVDPLPSPAYPVARRDGRPVGIALTRTFSDGTGWIGQLAVARAERGRGLGRALLLAGLRGRRDAGATQLGLGVQAANDRALRLYESVGLRIDREFRTFESRD